MFLWPLLGGFWALSPPNMAEISTRGSFSEDKDSLSTIFENLVFKQKWGAPKVDGFGPFLGPIYHWKTQNIAKKQNFPRN